MEQFTAPVLLFNNKRRTMKSSLSFATFGILLCFLSCERMGQDVGKSKIDDAPEVSFGHHKSKAKGKS